MEHGVNSLSPKDIELRYGLPAKIRIPLTAVSGNNLVHTGGYLYRIITRRLENGHYMQVNPENEAFGEFQMCYTEEQDKMYNYEYLGKPEVKEYKEAQ